MQLTKTYTPSKYQQDFQHIIDLAVSCFPAALVSIHLWEELSYHTITYSGETVTTITGFDEQAVAFLQTPRTFCMPNTNGLPATEWFKQLHHYRFYASVPIITGQQQYTGAFIIAHPRIESFTATQQNNLHSLARQAAIVATQQHDKKEHAVLKRKMEQIVFKVAHDIRNPLSALKNIIELHTSGLIDANDAKELEGMLLKDLNRVVQLTHIVSDWSKALLHTTGAGEYLLLKDCIDEQCRQLESVNTGKRNTIVNAVNPGQHIYTNKAVIAFTISSVLNNAIKFTTGGSIIFTTTRRNNKEVLKITDSGAGIAPRELDKLNGAGEFVTTKGTAGESGSGVSLFLVKELLKEVGKEITIKSEAGKGTEVLIEL